MRVAVVFLNTCRDSRGMWRNMSWLPIVLVLVGCATDSPGSEQQEETAPAAEMPVGTATGQVYPRLSEGPASDLPPNELGEIMVLEYHRLGEPETEWRRS